MWTTLFTGDETVAKAQHLKASAKSIFGEAKFELHKWDSNIPELESEVPTAEDENKATPGNNWGKREKVEPSRWGCPGTRRVTLSKYGSLRRQLRE